MRRVLAVAAGVVLLLAARAYLATGGSTPNGQPALSDVNDLESLKAAFNREAANTRLIILLAPSCPYCLKGASAIERILGDHRERGLVAFVIWQPMLPTDWGKPQSGALRRLADARVRQFWDADYKVAGALKASFQDREPQPQCCDTNGIWWDLMAVFPPGGEWKERLPEPVLLDGTVDEIAPEFAALFKK